ncbi:hypothetical protein EIN_209060 [Entamoeba invadens IP1]|uniref:SPRY domain-containing protein n=1 Tax=Entamoeba invadens IP1 TaxID=370355 RepID=L7FND0_ENTIV|nr:hypothetical protein EIN_209060 [Entamoeba invadens IP1]ELP94507.1 hypothetical protein EIN_209060 [Entamoeba invadens IP1]|eukprot:XP_004261278.1 hypothetical protein EIN_209060 [Entamoeba invadens IP1]
MSSKLELIYLLKVVFYFDTKEQLQRFICVNKTCEDTIKALKVSPVFINTISYVWFTKHFTPDTINFGSRNVSISSFMDNITYIRFPSFITDFLNGTLTKETLQKILPKITSLRFIDNDENDADINSLILENAKYLTHLQHLEGDIECITKFIEIYTEYGQEKYIKLPNKIVIQSSQKYLLRLDEVTYNKLERIQKCFFNSGNTTIYIVFSTVSSPLMYQRFSQFKDFVFYSRCYSKETSNFCHENLFVDSGKFIINGEVNSSDANTILEKMYCEKVIQSEVYQTYQKWDVSSIVTHFSLQNSFSLNDAVAISFSANIQNVIFLEIYNTQNFYFCDTFWHLETLIINRGMNIDFRQNSAFKALREMYVLFSGNVLIGSEFCDDKVEKFTIILSTQVFVKNTVTQHGKINIFASSDIKFLDQKIDKIKFYAEEIEKVEFYENAEERLFLEKESIFKVPTKIDKIEKNKNFDNVEIVLNETLALSKVFQMRKLMVLTPYLHIKKHKFYIDETQRMYEEISLLFSRNFYDVKSTEPFRYHFNGKEVIESRLVRYFELSVGLSLISVGIVDQNEYSDVDNCHVGWRGKSIGIHSDDGCIRSPFLPNDILEKKHLSFGAEIGKINCVGCGVYLNKEGANVLFFTINGKIEEVIKIDFNLVAVAIGVEEFSYLELNDGSKKDFKFDLHTVIKN